MSDQAFTLAKNECFFSFWRFHLSRITRMFGLQHKYGNECNVQMGLRHEQQKKRYSHNQNDSQRKENDINGHISQMGRKEEMWKGKKGHGKEPPGVTIAVINSREPLLHHITFLLLLCWLCLRWLHLAAARTHTRPTRAEEAKRLSCACDFPIFSTHTHLTCCSTNAIILIRLHLFCLRRSIQTPSARFSTES